MNVFSVVVSGAFDDIKSRDLRFLEEAAKLGKVTVLLWSDAMVHRQTGLMPKFSVAERNYFLKAVRYVEKVVIANERTEFNSLLSLGKVEVWADQESKQNQGREKFCQENKINYRRFSPAELAGFPESVPPTSQAGKKKVIATGCYDWFHSGHVRFFEEARGYGDLYVIVGHDQNIRLLKGQGHPLLPDVERRYVVGSIKYVKQALISTGDGWLDADPEIQQIKPDIYLVNEDGDKGGKREYCEKRGIEYLVLKRAPAPGLPKRTSTELRGF